MMNKPLRLLFPFVALLLLSILNAQTKPDFFRIEDLQPGMTGTGKTCFRGDKPEEFKAEILGVLRGVEPGANAVLARLSGEMLETTGVFEGMSGSPVYIDGKLLGAVAFTYPYAKEAICGITPITQMVDSFEQNAAGTDMELNLDSTITIHSESRPKASDRRDMFAESGLPSIHSLRQRPAADFSGHALVPIATPIGVGGLDEKTLRLFQPRFQSMGLSVFQGVGGGSSAVGADAAAVPNGRTLEPGSNIIIPLIRGDLDASAGGTVTYVDGDKIYAFGHSLLELGFTDLPVHRARTLHIFPSLQSSFKILEMGEAVGTISQDRGMGIYGTLGQAPRMIPMKVTLKTSRGVSREFKYELVRDSLLTPLLVNMAVYNTIAVSERGQGVVTLDIQGEIRVRNEQPVQVYNRFSSDSGVADAISLSAALPVNYLMSFGYKNLDIEDVDLVISAQESDQSALLDSIRLNRTEARAGESVDLEVACIRANGDTIRNIYPIAIPANITPGPVSIVVADGTTLMNMDAQPEDGILVPRDLSQLIKLINNLRRNDRLYVRLFRRENGAAVKGEGLPGLPPTILSILDSERKSGSVIPIGITAFLEFELPPTHYLVSGSKTLKIEIRP